MPEKHVACTPRCTPGDHRLFSTSPCELCGNPDTLRRRLITTPIVTHYQLCDECSRLTGIVDPPWAWRRNGLTLIGPAYLPRYRTLFTSGRLARVFELRAKAGAFDEVIHVGGESIPHHLLFLHENHGGGGWKRKSLGSKEGTKLDHAPLSLEGQLRDDYKEHGRWHSLKAGVTGTSQGRQVKGMLNPDMIVSELADRLGAAGYSLDDAKAVLRTGSLTKREQEIHDALASIVGDLTTRAVRPMNAKALAETLECARSTVYRLRDKAGRDKNALEGKVISISPPAGADGRLQDAA